MNQNAESRTHNQHDAGSDVMQIARAFVPIAPSGPSSHDPCRCPHIQKDGSGIDDQTSPEGHAAETKAVRPANILYRAKAVMSGDRYKPDWFWTGDQGLILSALVDRAAKMGPGNERSGLLENGAI